MLTKEEMTTLTGMTRFGGSFCQRLAELYKVADPQNRKKLKACFAAEWQRYDKSSEFYWVILEEEDKLKNESINHPLSQ